MTELIKFKHIDYELQHLPKDINKIIYIKDII
jgi:hypothetical protein